VIPIASIAVAGFGGMMPIARGLSTVQMSALKNTHGRSAIDIAAMSGHCRAARQTRRIIQPTVRNTRLGAAQ
jgi:hypothetical protein